MKLDIITIADRSKSDLENLIFLAGWDSITFGYWVERIAINAQNVIKKITKIKQSTKYNAAPFHMKRSIGFNLETAQRNLDCAELVLATIEWQRPEYSRPMTKRQLDGFFETVMSEVSEE